jgi:hypothetical protein
MTEGQLLLLKEVAGGKKVFRKASRSVRELEEFEGVVNDPLRLEAIGYIDGCETLTEAHIGMRYVDRVLVRGGLTDLGREALKDHS